MRSRFEQLQNPDAGQAEQNRDALPSVEHPPIRREGILPQFEAGMHVQMANTTTTRPPERRARTGGGRGGRGPEDDGTKKILHGFKYALEGMFGFLGMFAIASLAAAAGATFVPPALFFLGLGAMVGRILLAGWIQTTIMRQAFFAAGGLAAALTLYILGAGIVAGFPIYGGIVVASGMALLSVALVGAMLGFFDHKYRG